MENEEGISLIEKEEVVLDRSATILDGMRASAQTRAFTLLPDAVSVIDEAQRTVQLTFASEFPAKQRYPFGPVMETLRMTDTAANLTRLNAGGALLSEHSKDDQIGGVTRAWVGSDKRAYAVVKFSQSQRGQDFFNDVKDGIRKNISFGYNVLDGKVTEAKRAGEMDRVDVTSWEAFEISFVSVPADPTIGVGRSATGDEPEVQTPIVITKRGSAMEPVIEVSREDAILAFGKKFGKEDMARSFALDSNKSLEDFRAALLAEDKAEQARSKVVVEADATTLDLSKKEIKTYSVVRALNALVNNKRDGYEFELSDAIAKKLGRASNGIFVPNDIQRQKRDLSVGLGSQPTDGGALVGTDHMAASFIEVLRNNMVATKLGARMLSGLVGNVSIPRQNSGATVYWVAEGNAPTESQPGFQQLGLDPKTVGAVTEYTRQLLLQSDPSIDQLVMADLAAVMARGIDLAMIDGGGSNEPDGILSTSGVVDGTVGSGNGASFDWADAVNMETTLATANALLGSPVWLTTPAIRGALKVRTRVAASTFGDFIWADNQTINGYPAYVSTQVPTQAAIFGDFSQVIIGEWGVLELTANPFGSGFRAGNVEVRALQSIDIAIRYPQAFVKFEAFS